MQLEKQFLPLFIFIFLATPVHAEVSYKSRHLTAQEIERVRTVKALLHDVDKKSLRETINELEKTRNPQVSLEMREAMAKAYTDIVRDFNVNGEKKKEWLYSMVCLNMAYLQLGGDQAPPGSTTSLNRLIRKKLKEYLPLDIFRKPGFLYSL